jgi:uncharacterized glyoxalase superfamily protein PhnB
MHRLAIIEADQKVGFAAGLAIRWSRPIDVRFAPEPRCGRVFAAGADVVKPLRDEPWGMREFGLRTACGHRLMIGSDAA